MRRLLPHFALCLLSGCVHCWLIAFDFRAGLRYLCFLVGSQRAKISFLCWLSLFNLGLSSCVHAQSGILNGAAIKNGGKIIPPPQPLCLITTSSLPGATVGVFYSQTIQTSNCAAPVTFSISSGALPTWVTTVWPNTTGKIEGTPGAPDGGTNASFTVTATDANGHSATFNAGLDIPAVAGGGTPALPDTALMTWCTTVACTPSPNTVITIGDTPGTALCPASCNFSSTQLNAALASLSCGQTLAMENQVYQAANLTFNKACDQAHWITITRDPTDATFPAEGVRVTPCYAGIPSSALAGLPSYPCTSPARHMPFIQGTAAGGLFNIFGSYYRFMGIQWGRTNTFDISFGILAMANNPTDAQGNHLAPCTAPDLTCMNAQPTNNIFDRNIIQGDAQRQTSHAIGLGGTRWIGVLDSWIMDIGLTYEGNGGDAQPFAWGNGRELTNEGFAKFHNNFESASTMGNLFCGSFCEPLSPSTGFDGIPHDVWFNQDWFYKNPLWDTQIGQTQAAAQTVEGVSYPAVGDQEVLIIPSTVQLAAGQAMQFETLILNDSSGGINNIGPLSNGPSSMSVDGVTNGNATVGTVLRNGQHAVGTGSFQSFNQITYQYTAPASGTHSVCYNINLSDTRAATLGANRAISKCATVTVVASPAKIMAVTPNAPDLRIQPSYSDSFGNSRQFCYTMFAFPNYSPAGISWTIDGGAGNAVVGTIVNVSGSSFSGTSPSEVAYCSGTGLGAHTITATGDDGTFGSSVVTVSATAPITGFDLKPYTSKNGFELKCGLRILLENFLIENTFASNGNGGGQGGQIMLIHPLNQDGCSGSGANCQTSILSGNVPIGYGPFHISDTTIRNGKAIRAGAGFVVGGTSNTLGIHRVALTNILCDDCSRIHWSHGFVNNYFATAANGGPATVYSWESAANPMMTDIVYRHITLVGDNPNTFGINQDVAQPKGLNYVMQDSIFASSNSTTFMNPNGGNTNCNIAQGAGSSNTEARSLVACFATYTFNHLALLYSTADPSVFLSSPIWQPAGNDAGLFRNYNGGVGGDYRVVAGGAYDAGGARQASDGTALGADVTGINAIETQVRSGVRTP